MLCRLTGVPVLVALAAVLFGWTADGRLADSPGLSATPAVESSVPASSECRIEPRPRTFYEAILAQGSTPAAIPSFPSPVEGMALMVTDVHPADPATVTAVTSAVREFVACNNAGDVARLTALLSEDFVARLLATEGLSDEALDALAGTPAASPEPDGVALLEVGNVRLLEDGRVGAFVATAPARCAGRSPNRNPRLCEGSRAVSRGRDLSDLPATGNARAYFDCPLWNARARMIRLGGLREAPPSSLAPRHVLRHGCAHGGRGRQGRHSRWNDRCLNKDGAATSRAASGWNRVVVASDSILGGTARRPRYVGGHLCDPCAAGGIGFGESRRHPAAPLRAG